MNKFEEMSEWFKEMSKDFNENFLKFKEKNSIRMKNYQEVLDYIFDEMDEYDIKDWWRAKMQELVDKEKPQLPIVEKIANDKLYYCPNCNKYLIAINKPRCCECGQLIDWSDNG